MLKIKRDEPLTQKSTKGGERGEVATRGDYIIKALRRDENGKVDEDKINIEACRRFKEIIQSISVEELSSHLIRTEFNFDTVALELTFSFAVEQDKDLCR